MASRRVARHVAHRLIMQIQWDRFMEPRQVQMQRACLNANRFGAFCGPVCLRDWNANRRPRVHY